MSKKWWLWVISAAIAVTLALAQNSANDARASWQSRTTWSEYGGGPDGSHYSALTQINRSNINQLQVAWTYPAEGGGEYSPLVAGKLAYVIAKGGSVVALAAGTGKEVWA